MPGGIFGFHTETPPTTTPFTTSLPWTTSPGRDPHSCLNYCDNGGSCSLTGPQLTAICSCNHGFRGNFCQEVVYWFEFLWKDQKITGNGILILFCITVSLAILSFTGVIFYRRYKRRKSKSKEKTTYQQNTNPNFDDVHASSRQELLVYQVAQPPAPLSPPPAPCSPQGHGICYLVPTSPDHGETAAWQDYHNPGYRQSYIDSGV